MSSKNVITDVISIDEQAFEKHGDAEIDEDGFEVVDETVSITVRSEREGAKTKRWYLCILIQHPFSESGFLGCPNFHYCGCRFRYSYCITYIPLFTNVDESFGRDTITYQWVLITFLEDVDCPMNALPIDLPIPVDRFYASGTAQSFAAHRRRCAATEVMHPLCRSHSAVQPFAPSDEWSISACSIAASACSSAASMS